MNSIFNKAGNQTILDKLSRIKPDSKALWGKMTVEQMLVHCQKPFDVAEGNLKLKRNFVGFLFGKMFLKKILNNDEMQKNMPTDKVFIITSSPNFEIEKQKLAAFILDFGTIGHSKIKDLDHPFFGKMTPEQWGGLAYKHLYHHLTQFGA
jgi:hypothetical protein